ncbi:IS5 family transposase [Pontibacter actiniarum]|uniref:DDE transposase n=1 Tax=Pontibacter actiniarum TaxID=323450 RepID=A0A1X9YYU6_9BACT|nr:IS5 family transposase [Pontibacter actiniarum]ARS38150.1 DDE transposase [Pontibacter actiniarum]
MESQYKRLTDSQWAVVKASLPVERKRKHSLRVIVDAIFYMLRVGCQWRNLPEESFPKWQLVYYYFSKWQQDGTLERLNFRLNIGERERQGKKASPSLMSIDSQSVKVAPFVGEETGVDGNKKVNGRKRHVITDTLGLVWGVVVHAAHRADGVLAGQVVAPLKGYLHRMEKILADAAYEKVFMGWVTENLLGVELEISSKPPDTEGFVPVKWRWVTERSFGIFNFFRRLDKDHEKTPESAQSWVLWQNCQVVINRIA